MAELRRPVRIVAVVAIVLATIGCDHVTKQFASRHLAGRPRLSMAADSLRLEYVENPGGFLGIGSGLPEAVRGAIALGTTVLLAWLGIWVCRRVLAGEWALGPALVWAGGFGNLVDRMTRGSVVDFLNVGVGSLRTGIFNAADVAITLGVILIALDLAGPTRTRDRPC